MVGFVSSLATQDVSLLSSSTRFYAKSFPSTSTCRGVNIRCISHRRKSLSYTRLRCAVAGSVETPQFQIAWQSIKTLLVSFCLGTVTGAIGASCGSGGGFLLTPLLTSCLGLSQHKAQGTSLVCVAISAVVSTLLYGKGKSLLFSHALMLCLGALTTSYLGAKCSSMVDAKKLRTYFGAFLILVSFLVGLPKELIYGNAAATTAAASTSSSLFESVANENPIKLVTLTVIGSIIGFIAALLGLGGGVLNVPSLVLVFGLSQKVAQGTSLAAMILPSSFACAHHIQMKNIAYFLLPGLISGIMLGANVGGHLALAYFDESTLRVICSTMFGLIGALYIHRNRNRPVAK